MVSISADWSTWLWAAVVLTGAAIAGVIAYSVFFSIGRRVSMRTRNTADQSLFEHAARPAKLLFPVIAMFLATTAIVVPEHALRSLRHLLALIFIAGLTWLMIALLKVPQDLITARYRIDIADNLQARRIRTQVEVLRRIAVFVLLLIGLAAMLMTFPTIWNVGAGLFASAGAAGLIVGMAARPALSNLLAGLQIALTEPIRLDDVVIVEGEWGWVEEIHTTYIVVRIWDLRRLILPLSYFIEKPFQNWTRRSADILGTVFVYVDYTVPVDEVRAELHRILQSSDLWDKKAWGLQVTNVNERAMELRALMSASDSGKAWNLRCDVRERLITFLQERYPKSLPRARMEMFSESGEPSFAAER